MNKGLWTLAGTAGPITVTSVGTLWGGIDAAGTLTSVRVVTGGLPADITAGSITSLVVGGALSGDITAGTITSLSASGVLSGDVTTTGNLRSLRASQLVGALIDVGGTATSVADVTAIGTSKLTSLVLTSHAANTFSDSSIVADVIGSAVIGSVNASGTPEGIATGTISGLTLTLNGKAIHAPAKDLTSQDALSSFVGLKSLSLGDFVLDIV